MAKKNKKSRRVARTKSKSSVKRNVSKSQSKKFVLSTGIVGVCIVIALILAVFFYFGRPSVPTQNNNGQQTSTQPNMVGAASQGGSCSKSSQCFITHCKGQAESCVNTTVLTDYSKNCQSYLDWVIDTQDADQCACVNSACRMIN